MTSQAQALDPLPEVRGLAFLGFPLHPAGKPGIDRAAHLAGVQLPMLFVSGDRDALAELDLFEGVVATLGSRASLHRVAFADHSFKVAARSGRTSAEAEAEALDAIAEWMLQRSA
jgi:predicted alpha/beta-hydrolase family hydrolase